MTDYKLRIIVEGSDSGASQALGGVSKSLDALENKAKSTAAGIGNSLKSMGSAMTSAGKGLSLAVTTPLVGIAAVALNSAAKFEQNMNLIQASTSATGDQMKAMQQIAIDLGAKTVFSAGEAAQGLLELSYAGLNAQQSMDAISGVLDLAAAGNLSVASAAETTANALNAFHLQASEATNIANMFAAAASASSVEVSDMTQSFAASSAVFATYGQSIYDLSTGLAILGNNGIKGSDAGTSLKTMMSRLAAPTDTAGELMQYLGIQVYDASGQMRQFPAIMASVSKAMSGLNDQQRNAAMYQIFGSDALRAASILLKEGTTGWDAMSAKIHEGGKATLLADARMKGLAGAIEYWSGSVDSFLISAALPFQDFFSNILRQGADFLTSIGQWDDSTKAWAIGIGVAAAAAGPLLIVVGTLATTMGAALPVLAAVGSALLPVAAGLGILYGAYRLNVGGLRAFIDTGLNRVQKAAPLAGRALTELVTRVRAIGTNTLVTGNGIRDFVGALTGSEETANNVTNGIIRLISRVDAAKVAFDSAGGGIQGFTAGLSQLVGQKITLDFKDNIVKLTWGDIFDLSAGFDPGDWSKGFVKLKIGDMVDFTQDWTNGITKLKIKDLIDFSTDSAKTTLKISDLVDFSTDSEKTKLSIKNLFVMDTTAGKEKLKLGDFYELDNTTSKNKLKFGDWYEWDNGKETIKVGDFYNLDETAGKETIKFGDWYTFDTTGDKVTINIWDWYKLEETPTQKTIKLGDYVAFDSTKTVLKFGDWFEWNMDEIHFDFHDLFPKKLDLTELLFGTTTTKGINLGVKMQGPTLDGFKPPVDFLAGVKWPEPPAFKWPEFPKISVEWPKLPEIKWPSFTWPDYNAWTWPDYLKFAWPDYNTWTWPEIKTPSWLADLLAWNPTVTISGTISSAIDGVSAAVDKFFGGGTQGPPAPAKGDPEVFFNVPKHAKGTDNFAGGWTWVGEKGPELLNLPAGSKIMSNQKSMGMIGKLADGNFSSMPPLVMPKTQAITASQQPWPQSKAMTASPVNIANDAKMLARMTDSYNALKSIENLSRIGPDKIVQAQDKNQLKLQQSIDGMFQKAPGLMQTSEVTQDQLDMAKLGIPQNFADDWVRHLTDEVVNGVQWSDADIKDAAMRAGIDPSLPAKAILGMVKDQWNSGQFFADTEGNAKNTDLLNMDAIKQSILQQQQQAAGKENLMQLSAIFGGTAGDLTKQGQDLGGQARAGIVQGLSGSAGAGAAGSTPDVDLSTILLGGSSTGITPEAVAPLAASFVSAFATALTGGKDDKEKGGIDFGAAIVAALTASLGNSDALAGVGQAILQKITESWKTIKDVDFIGGMAAAMSLQIDTQSSIDALKNLGGKIAHIIKAGIDEYFKDAAVADSINNSVSSTTTTTTAVGANAAGTNFWRGGLTWVGERGAELVNLPRGAQVFNNGQSMAMAGAGGGGGDIHIHATINTPIDLHLMARQISKIQQKQGGR